MNSEQHDELLKLMLEASKLREATQQKVASRSPDERLQVIKLFMQELAKDANTGDAEGGTDGTH